MKISLENPSRMVLKDRNYSAYILGAIFFILGVYSVFSLLRNPINIGGWFFVLLGLVGLWLIASNKMTTVILDKETGKGSVAVLGLISGKMNEFDLSRIRKLTLSEAIGGATEHGNSYLDYTVNLVMDSGEQMPFRLAYELKNIVKIDRSPEGKITRTSTTSTEQEKKSAQQIADFLGVPMEFIWVPSPGRMSPEEQEAMMKEADRLSKRQ